MPRAIQPAWVHPDRAIIQTFSYFPLNKKHLKISARFAAQGKLWPVPLFISKLSLISGANRKQKKSTFSSAKFASPRSGRLPEGMKKKNKWKRFHEKFWKTQHVLKHSHVRRLRDWQMSIFSMNLPDFLLLDFCPKQTQTNKFSLDTLHSTPTRRIRDPFFENHGGKKRKLKKNV